MRITITCEDCGRRHRLERSVDEPGPIWIVCHDCELPLRAVLEENHQTTAAAATGPGDERFREVWSQVLDMSSSGSSAAS
jgi:hypothetical protein